MSPVIFHYTAMTGLISIQMSKQTLIQTYHFQKFKKQLSFIPAVVIGNCYIGKLVLVAPTAVCRGDEGTPIHVSDFSNMQDGAILHGLITTDKEKALDGRRFSEAGDRLMGNSSQFAEGYSVFVGTNTSLAHDSMVHGPAW